MGITCCKDCVPPKRHLNCHSECDDYIQEKSKHEEVRNEIRKLKTADYNMHYYVLCQMERNRKHRRVKNTR